MKFKHKQTGKVVNADMLFINDYSDGGTASLRTTMGNILMDYDLEVNELISEIATAANMSTDGSVSNSFYIMCKEDIVNFFK